MPPPLPLSVRRHGSSIVSRLLERHRATARDLPWRRRRIACEPGATAVELNDPWLVLVSEIMLQQTQADRIAVLLPPFLERYPEPGALARASRAEVLHAWRGLGYNRRALRLHETAQLLVARHGGTVPRDIDAIASLPGVGPNTTSAVACFAFDAHVPVVDTNVVRVLSRILFRCHDAAQRMPVSAIRRVAEALIPPGEALAWNEALMDHGATVCTAARPSCDACPVAEWCLSRGVTNIGLFHPLSARKPEPLIAGEPRRIWRGRIVEWLRGGHAPHTIDDLVAAVAAAHAPAERKPQTARPSDSELHQPLKALVATLIAEGLVEGHRDIGT